MFAPCAHKVCNWNWMQIAIKKVILRSVNKNATELFVHYSILLHFCQRNKRKIIIYLLFLDFWTLLFNGFWVSNINLHKPIHFIDHLVQGPDVSECKQSFILPLTFNKVVDVVVGLKNFKTKRGPTRPWG